MDVRRRLGLMFLHALCFARFAPSFLSCVPYTYVEDCAKGNGSQRSLETAGLLTRASHVLRSFPTAANVVQEAVETCLPLPVQQPSDTVFSYRLAWQRFDQ